MRDKILKIIQQYPKHYTRLIKKDQDLLNWVCEYSLIDSIKLSEKIYSALHQQTNVCINGKLRKFKDISSGFIGCGPANQCLCVKESVSRSVGKSVSVYDVAQKTRISDKRKQTNLEKYGVANAGQTTQAKKRHTEFYQNQINVSKTIKKQQDTLFERYGVDQVANIPGVSEKRKQTMILRYGVENPQQNKEIRKKTIETRKKQYDPHTLLENNFQKFKSFIFSELNLTVLSESTEYIDVGGQRQRPLLKFKCNSCNTEFNKRFDYASLPKCKQCNPYIATYKSTGELEVLDFIKSIYNGEIISGSFGIINPFQIDIFIPNLKLGFEFNGLYWHSENSGKKKFSYHKKKHDLMNEKGNRLITIFSDEWCNSRTIIENKIRNLLNKSNRIYARKCISKQISAADAKVFIKKYHIQDAPIRLPINYGIFNNNELVAVMGFVKKNNNQYELSRFASIVTVVGGASKLLTHFTRDYAPNSIVSFSDNRWSDGNLYKKLGFVQTGIVPPMQHYVKNYIERIHKLALSKEKLTRLYDTEINGRTEWEMLQELGYDRIWDAGKIKWVKYV